jgi:2-(1,2-epoxy-1,2-dihydrophenyl)acetyl-CoA isomerase
MLDDKADLLADSSYWAVLQSGRSVSMMELVQLELHETVAILTLNRPERHNSLVPELLEELLARLAQVEAAPDVRAVILQANGRSFSTGGDVAGFVTHLDSLEAYALRIVGLLNETILALLQLPAPVVAAVQGIVTGGSLGLLLACDLVLVAPQATFTPYYSVVGFSPDGGWTALLPALIGPKRAAAILMQNQTISAEEALAWGLANKIVTGDSLRVEALKVAQEIAAKKAGSIRHTKRLMFGSHGDVARRLEEERARFVRQIVTPEARQGMATFLDRRRA